MLRKRLLLGNEEIIGLILSKKNISVTPPSGSTTVNITDLKGQIIPSSNLSITSTYVTSTSYNSSNGKLTINYPANTDLNNTKSGRITIKYKGVTEYIKLTQEKDGIDTTYNGNYVLDDYMHNYEGWREVSWSISLDNIERSSTGSSNPMYRYAIPFTTVEYTRFCKEIRYKSGGYGTDHNDYIFKNLTVTGPLILPVTNVKSYPPSVQNTPLTYNRIFWYAELLSYDTANETITIKLYIKHTAQQIPTSERNTWPHIYTITLNCPIAQ